LVLNRVKIQNSQTIFKAKQVKIEAIQINFFLTLLPIFNFFRAVAYSAKAKIPGKKG
jgi:hypothetical protein